MRVLDVGCCDGKRVKKLQDRGYDAYGIDITNKHFIKGVKNLLRGDVGLLISNNFFDMVYMTDVLEHLKIGWDFRALKNINLALKKGGELRLTTPCHVPFLNWYDPAWIKWKLGGKRHKHYSWKELKELLNEAGFKIISAKKTGNIRWVLSIWFNKLLRLCYGFEINYPRTNGYFHWEVVAIKK